jgi:hypothetical protein
MPGRRRGAEGEPVSEQPGGRHRHRLLKVAVLGGAVALLLSDDLRSQLLDKLFGAEEEFSYSSLTEPPAPAADHSPSEPWVRPSEPEQDATPVFEPASGGLPEPEATPVFEPASGGLSEPEATPVFEPASAEAFEPASAEAPEPEATPVFEPGSAEIDDEPAGATRVGSSISPSPAAWRAAAEPEVEEDQPVETQPGGSPGEAAAPAPPPRWWAPNKPGSDPLDD